MSFSIPTTVLVFVVVLVVVAPSVVADYESVSGQQQACGWGSWHSGEERTFSHIVSFSIQIDWDRGYVVDCYSGTDAYFEWRGVLPGDLYLYAVWGQLGEYY